MVPYGAPPRPDRRRLRAGARVLPRRARAAGEESWEAEGAEARIAILDAGRATLEMINEEQAAAIDEIEVGAGRRAGPSRLRGRTTARRRGAARRGGRRAARGARRHAVERPQRPPARARTGCSSRCSPLWTDLLQGDELAYLTTSRRAPRDGADAGRLHPRRARGARAAGASSSSTRTRRRHGRPRSAAST